MAALEPYVWVYCQNPDMLDHSHLLPLAKQSRFGGELVKLENVGRESHAFLQHITRHYDELAEHTLFSQDMPNYESLLPRFEVSSDWSPVVQGGHRPSRLDSGPKQALHSPCLLSGAVLSLHVMPLVHQV